VWSIVGEEPENDNARPTPDQCREIHDQAITECTEEVLECPTNPSSGNEWAFRNCINDKLRAAGCL
jgi:hypothetical protein